MKIIFYSLEKPVKKFFDSIEVKDAFLCTQLEEVEAHFSSEDHSIVFLDFDSEDLKCTELAKELNVIENINTVLVSGKMSLKEILDFQNTDNGCDAYITKPLATDILAGVINDFEIALSAAEDDAKSDSTKTDNVDLTFVGIKKDLLDQLDEMEVEEEEEDDFNAGQMQVASEVRDIIDSHRSDGANFDSVANDDIQRKFDCVFGETHSEANDSNEDEFNITPQGFDSDNKTEENGISFNLEDKDDSPSNDIEKEVIEPTESVDEVKMSNENDNDSGLEFNIPDEESDVSQEAVIEDQASTDELIDEPDDGGGLEFNLGDEEVTETSVSDTDGATETSSDLDFSDDASGDLDLSGDEDNVEASQVEDEDGLSFDDTSGSLSLGESDDSSGVETAQAADDDGLSFDDDDESDSLNLNESYDGEEASVDEPSSNDDIDFSTKEEPAKEEETEEGMSFSDIDDTDSSFDTGMGTNTSNDIESTISSIVAPDTSDENSTGEFDLSSVEPEEEEDDMQEFDYKTSSGFSPLLAEEEAIDDDEFGDIDDSLGDDTNPTMIASTSTLTASALSGNSDDQNSDDELLFSESTGTNDFNTIEKEDEVVEEDNFSGFSPQEEVTTTTVSDNQTVEASPESIDNFSRNYDEDEMLRLQGTIRQLREERESLMENINTLTSEKQLLSQDNLGLKAELDEVKIELEIVKKRSHDEVSEMKYQMNLSQEKRDVYEMKYKTLHKEFERLNQKVRIDFNQVKQREKELESKLELVVMDSDSQVQSRDMKILELKRKIDSLEFNMENSSIREQKHREDKSKLEERLAKIMKTLRGSIQLIEDDLEVLETDTSAELDKN